MYTREVKRFYSATQAFLISPNDLLLSVYIWINNLRKNMYDTLLIVM